MLYLIIINCITFVVYGIDKIFAIFHKLRIMENFLFMLSLIGGALGALLGMAIFRHKIRKVKFYFVNFISFFIWMFIIYKMR